MTARQLEEWKVFEDLEPFSHERLDVLFGYVVQTLLNVNRGKKAPIKLDDCVLRFGDSVKARRKADWRAMKKTAMMLTKLSEGAE